MQIVHARYINALSSSWWYSTFSSAKCWLLLGLIFSALLSSVYLPPREEMAGPVNSKQGLYGSRKLQESSGNLLNSSEKIWNVWQTIRRINIKILGVNGLMWILESWKNQSESWESPGKVQEICFWKRVRTLSKACLWPKFIIWFIRPFWLAEMSSD